eukprot:80911-Amphidinium_carterae.1
MDYFKTMLNAQNNLNKKPKFPRLTGHLRYLRNRRLMSTILHIYHTEIGASIVYKERANHNIINEED